MKTYPVAASQKEILALERFIGGSINNIAVSLLFSTTSHRIEAFAAISDAYRRFPLLNAVLVNESKDNMDRLPETNCECMVFSCIDDFQQWAKSMSQNPINPQTDKTKIFYIDIPNEAEGFFVYAHHAFVDGWSVGLLLEMLSQCFADALRQIEPAQAEVFLYEDYCNNDCKYVLSKRHDRDTLFWKGLFGSAPLPTLFWGRDSTQYDSKRISFSLDRSTIEQLEQYSNATQNTPFAVFLSTVALTCYRAFEKSAFYLGTLLPNRTTAAEMNTLGCFFSTVPIPFSMDGHTFQSLLKKTSDSVYSILRHQRLSYTEIIEQYQQVKGSKDILFDVFVNWQDFSSRNYNDGQITWYPPSVQLEALQMNIEYSTDSICIHYDYRKACLTEAAVKRMHDRLMVLLQEALTRDDVPLSILEQCPISDRKQIAQWNNTTYEFPRNETLSSLFISRARNMPNATALIMENESITYGELHDRSNRLAHYLRECCVHEGDIVAVMLERSFSMLIAIYAIHKCGAAYMPIGTQIPYDRIGFMLSDSEACAILTSSDMDFPETEGTIRVNVDRLELSQAPCDDIMYAHPEGKAYVIYTSGSTGMPKGAIIAHHSAVNRIHWMNRIFGMTKQDVVLQKTPYTFDVSVWELFWSLMYGGSLAILAPDAHKDPQQIVDAIEKHGVTKLHFVPSMLAAFMQYLEISGDYKRLQTVCQVFVSGEALMPAHVERFYRLLPQAELINLYGPTECTVDVTCYPCPREHLPSVPIGWPVDNTQIHIVDAFNKEVPIGEAGELCIAGNLVGLGYLKREELTKEKFIDNPFGYGKLYKTGDLASWNSDGSIAYLGRIDFQVKLNGQRLELEEIEQQLLGYHGINQSVAKVQKDESGADVLVAYYTGAAEVDSGEIISFLKNKLPDYMVPQHYMYLTALPLTVSGKTDRKSLPAFNFSSYSIDRTFVAPQTQMQRRLCSAFAEALSISNDNIGIDDDFFALGGGSLKAITLMTLLHGTYGISVRAIYEHPTVRQLEQHYQSRSGDNNYAGDEAYRSLQISSYQNAAWQTDAPVLITGATGFLGIHLLRSISLQHKGEIYCLVRNSKRLLEQWQYMFPCEEMPKVTCVIGDVTKEKLGLCDDDYQELASKIQHVFHSAADVRHFGRWEDSYKTNTVGTQRMIDFCQLANAQLNHVSTMSVSGYVLTHIQNKQTDVFDENMLFIGQQYKENIYVHSKYLAERYMIDAMACGLQANIFRVGNLLWRESDCHFIKNREQNDFYMLSQGFSQIGIIPKEYAELMVDFTPVDACAEGIVKLAMHRIHGVYHMFNPHMLTLHEYMEKLIGNSQLSVDMDVFQRQLISYKDDAKMAFLMAYIDANSNMTSDSFPTGVAPTTVKELEALGFEWNMPTARYLSFVSEGRLTE